MTILDDRFIKAHVDMQTCCYYSGIDRGSHGEIFCYSDHIEGSSWNHAFFVELGRGSGELFVKQAAKRRNRAPTVFVNVEEVGRSSRGDPSIEHELWMKCSKGDQRKLLSLDVETFLSFDAVPHLEYFDVFADLFSDSSVNKLFIDQYIPALKSAKNIRNDIEVVHATLCDDGIHVACGSLYIQGELAGLYGVGTRSKFQRRGFGTQVSLKLLSEAFSRGAKCVFLQCAPGGYVEKLYHDIGFKPIGRPGFVTL